MKTGTESADALEALAAVLGRDQWVTVLTAHGPGRSPRLYVTSRTAPGLASDIYAEAGWYWWPHAQRIAPTSAPRHAAATLTRTILGTTVGEERPATPTPAAGHARLPRRIPPDRPGQARRVPPDGHTETGQ
ncbi:MAG TPA: hypothetical protein VGS19_26925 [Streptosporangiaceae bacterium]|nr:hypothetical protein [Streptosporangiaceae bacterium]